MGSPTVTPLNESFHTGGFIVSEANGHLSRETITLASGSNLGAGAVLGKVTASGKYVVLAPAAADGSQNAAGILFAAKDATSGDKPALAIVRQAEVNGSELVWPAGITGPQTTAALANLAALGIVSR